MTLHLGKRSASPLQAGTPLLRDLLRALPSGSLPSIPTNFGHGYDFGRYGWQMLGNGPCDDNSVDPSWAAYDGAGNCLWAGASHEEMEAAKDAGRPVPHFTCLNTLEQYAAYSGYDPKSGTSDNGSDVQEVYAWRQTKGLLDANGKAYKMGKYVALTPGDLHELWAATYLFECVGIGFVFQQAQMDQFNAGKVWDYVPGSPTEGGHYVPIVGNNGCISWAQRVGWTQAWYKNLCDEAYCYIDAERYNQITGKTAEHYADVDLEQYILQVAQYKSV